MQIAYSQYAGQDVVVAAGFNFHPARKFFLRVTLRNDDRVEDLDPRDIVYDSVEHPLLDWSFMQTLLDELEWLAVPVSPQFIANLSNEKTTANRHLDITYADDDTELPF